ncbi:MAG: hypothetical protein NC397_09290 [Clostridium sp.]|nr:hypothetical protein [Clostridium sp.]
MAMSKKKITLENDLVVNCSLGFAALKNLRHKDKGLYDLANTTLAKGVQNITDTSKLIYASYLAVNEDAMSENEFFEVLPDSYGQQSEILRTIIA